MSKQRFVTTTACTLVLACITGAFSGCVRENSSSGPSSVSSSAVSSEKKGVKIGCSMNNMVNPFYQDVKKGMDSAMKPGDELIVIDAKLDPAKQVSDIEDLIQQKVDAILVDPVDSKGIKASLEDCKKAGIPVIAWNNPVADSDLVATTVSSDNLLAGKLCAQALAKAIGNKGKIAMYEYNVVEAAKDRADGFKAEIVNYPDIKIVNEQEGNPSTDAALPIMENMLQATPDIAGVFALNDPAAIGCIAAIESAGKIGQIKVVGIDGSDEGKGMIKAGKMIASVAQSPKEIGSVSVESAYNILEGKSVKADQKIPVNIVDRSNAG